MPRAARSPRTPPHPAAATFVDATTTAIAQTFATSPVVGDLSTTLLAVTELTSPLTAEAYAEQVQAAGALETAIRASWKAPLDASKAAVKAVTAQFKSVLDPIVAAREHGRAVLDRYAAALEAAQVTTPVEPVSREAHAAETLLMAGSGGEGAVGAAFTAPKVLPSGVARVRHREIVVRDTREVLQAVLDGRLGLDVINILTPVLKAWSLAREGEAPPGCEWAETSTIRVSRTAPAEISVG